MANTGLKGPFWLSSDVIDEVIQLTSAGTYVLGYKNSEDAFIVEYVGRSDSDINGRLKSWVGKNGYKRFKFDYFRSPKAAFEKECTIYHDFKNLDNEIHPQRPKDASWQCPVCNVFD